MSDEWWAELFNGDEVQNRAIAAQEEADYAIVCAKREAARLALVCQRWSGKGRLSGYSHIKGGECFRCNGSGIFSRGAC